MRYRIRRTGSPVVDHSERTVIAEFVSNARDGDVIWDVGAKTGSYCEYARAACTPGELHAFEPSPASYSALRKRLNRLPGDFRRELHRLAIGNERDSVRFAAEMPEHASTSAGAIVRGSDIDEFGAENVIEVPIVPGDALIRRGRVTAPDLLKVDVEGAEMDVLKGLRESIAAGDIRCIICEVHLPTAGPTPSIFDFGHAPEDVHAFLEDHGYAVGEIGRRERDYHILATRSPHV